MRRLDQLRRTLAEVLRACGVDNADGDARAIVASVLGVAPSQFVTAADVTAAQEAEIAELGARRAAREPLQHILGVAYFRHLELGVGPGVFVPRPETEVLVDAALEVLGDSGGRVVDIGAGSGAISLAIATERTGQRVLAVEPSADAREWLRRNVEAHAPQLRAQASSVEILPADAALTPLALGAGAQPALTPGAKLEASALAAGAKPDAAAVPAWVRPGSVDVVVSNPPYVPDAMVPRQPEARLFDPPTALYGGTDGMDIVRNLVDSAAALLKPGGWLLIEHGEYQAGGGVPGDEGVPGVIDAHRAFAPSATRADLTGRPRVTLAARRSTL